MLSVITAACWLPSWPWLRQDRLAGGWDWHPGLQHASGMLPSGCRRAPGLRRISGRGSARLRVRGHVGSRVIAARVLGYQLSRGLLQPAPDGRLPVIRHTCDESACANPGHWVLGTKADNSADYEARRHDPLSPLADLRGPAGRARAIRDAILEAQSRGASPEAVDHSIRRAMDAGMPGVQDALIYGDQAARES